MRRPAPAFALLLAACAPAADDRPLDVSVIDAPPRLADRERLPLGSAAALLADATAEGLVAFDAAGQTEPALAERWIVADDGRALIFRLTDLDWPDGRPVTAQDVARRIRAAIASGSRNPYRPITGAIAQVVAVTPQVVEVRLSAPRPNLLQLFAQPEFAVLRGGAGAGPYVATAMGGVVTLTPRRPEGEAEDPRALPASPAETIRLRGERAARAIVGFVGGLTDGVFGGRFIDLPLVRAAGIAPGALRLDPASGLFGLVFGTAGADAPTADATVRRALAMSLDRAALVAAFGAPGSRTETRLVGGEVDDLPAPAEPDWSSAPLPDRRAAAAAAVAAWRAAHGGAELRVRVDAGPGWGGRLLAARLAADWAAIGVRTDAVAVGSPADLRLIDEVAPGEIASWYLRRFRCEMAVPCTPETDVALEAARRAPTLAERTLLLAEADRLMAATVPFVPLARPVRWSLVGRRLTGWRESPRAFHPLRHLRERR